MYTKVIAGKSIIGLSIAGMLLSAAPMAMARDNNRDDDVRVNASATAKVEHEDNGLHLGWILGAHKGEDKKADHVTSTASTTKHKGDEHKQLNAHVVGGAVTSVSGNTIVLGGKATTTVTIDGNTKIVTRDGATTTAAITTGAKVIAFGSTTAASTSGTSFTASVVIVLNKAFGHFKHWLHF